MTEGDKHMPATNGFEPAGGRDDTAIDWLVLLHSGTATPDDHRAFAHWRRQSDAHEAAAREAEALWDEIGQTATALAFVPETNMRRALPLSRRTLLAGTVAASVGGVTMLSGTLRPSAGLLADYRTRRGERRQVALPDGSIAWLNTQTALSVDFSASARRFTLYAGEALFEVRKHAARPFIVAAGGGEARALGTSYAVRYADAGVEVDVIEGVAGVRAMPGAALRKLTAGQRTRYADGRFASGVEAVNGRAATAWQRGKLIFNNRPLGEVVAELQRHRYERIVIADAALAAMPVTGVFDLDDDDATFAMLSQTLPVRIRRLPLLTLLHRTGTTA